MEKMSEYRVARAVSDPDTWVVLQDGEVYVSGNYGSCLRTAVALTAWEYGSLAVSHEATNAVFAESEADRINFGELAVN